MATKLFLRNIQDNAIGATYFDMVTTAGGGTDTATAATTTAGTEIQLTKNAAVIQWVSGRAPSGGFTLTTSDVSLWLAESNMNANCGGRFRVFKRTGAGVETEIGGPFDDGVEFPVTTPIEHLWIGNVTDTAFAENDRILLKLYITAAGGTMASGHTCTLTFNGPDAATGDSFFNIAETVAFKAEDVAAGHPVMRRAGGVPGMHQGSDFGRSW